MSISPFHPYRSPTRSTTRSTNDLENVGGTYYKNSGLLLDGFMITFNTIIKKPLTISWKSILEGNCGINQSRIHYANN